MAENTHQGIEQRSPALFRPDARQAMAFSRACPRYTPTELATVTVEGHPVLVKNESTRYGLGSFKALGGIYAVARLLLEHQPSGEAPLSMDDLFTERVREHAGTQTYVCASAGNHGMAVATGARLFGAKARIHISAEVPASFAGRLEERGAQACISGADYEESLTIANEDCRNTGALLLADGSWEGYTHAPALVMEGYTVMGTELQQAFEQSGHWPSDVYLQAGVGGMAAALTWMIRQHWSHQPRIVIVEPDAARCLALSAANGQLTEATGPVSTMGRLDCKAASLLAWDTLIRSNVEYAAVTDEEAEQAVKVLHNAALYTSESGAAGLAALRKDRTAGRLAGEAPLIIMSEQAVA